MDNSIIKKNTFSHIPSDWEVIELGKLITNSYSGGTPSRNIKEYYELGTIPWIKSGEINQIYINETEECITKEALNNSSAKLTPKGTLLYALYGATAGVVGFTNIEAALNQAILAIFPDEKKLLKEYLFFFLTFNKEKILNEFTQGGQPNLSAGLVKGLKLSLPPLPEQKAIAKVLGLQGEIINKTNQLINQKEQQKKWLMQQLLSGKKRLKGFKDEWKKYSYEKLFNVIKRSFKWNDEELYKLISVRRRSGGIFLRDSLYGHQIKVKDLRNANEGDFLFSKMQILHGASALVTKEFAGAKISGSYIAVVAKDPVILNMEYLNRASQLKYFYHQTYISSYGVHIEKMTFDFETFLSLEIKLPPIEEQIAIAQVLQSADKEIQLLKTKLEKLKEQKKGLMQVLLTGKKRLKIDN